MSVKDFGPPSPDIMFIGEAPSSLEERTGVCFSDQRGKLLQHMCRHVQIDWSKCYGTNLINKRPHRGNFHSYYVDKARRTPTPELETVWRDVRDKIKQLNPKCIVTLGPEALRAVTGKRGIDNWRGCPLDMDGIPVIPTYAPGAVMRNYSFHPICELDLQKAGRWSQERPEPQEWNIILEPTLQQVKRFLQGCRGGTVAFDLESIGETVRCIGFARKNKNTKVSICVPFLHFSSYQPSSQIGKQIISIGERESGDCANYWKPEQEKEIIELIGELFEDESIRKIGQNSLGFDQPFLEREFGWKFNNHDFDCMHGFHLLYAELPKSLSFLCSILTDYPNYWTEKNTQDDMSEWRYNCWDTIITLDVEEVIQEDLEQRDLMWFYRDRLHPLACALTRAQERGVLVDTKRRDDLIKHYLKQQDDRQQLVRLCAKDRDLNINSHPQLKKLIYDTMGYKPVTNKQGRVSTDEECLKKLIKKYPDEEIFKGIMDYRKAGKMLNFLESKTKENGRMCTSFNASGTETGRISSSKTIWGTGMNLMNVPKYLRDIFIAPQGRSFIKEDLSQAETMVVAHILRRHGDPTLYEKYQDPDFDIHTWMASCIYKKPENQITKFERNVGKLANHSGNYRAGPQVLSTAATKYGIPGITYAVAKEILTERSKALPGLQKWWQWIEDELRKTRTLKTCLGRQRIFFGRLDHATFRHATAFEPQSIVGDLTNIIFTSLDRELDADCYPVLQVHDEVVIEGPDKKIPHMLDTLKKVGMIELWINPDVPLIIPMDVGIGKNWKDCPELELDWYDK